MAERATAETTTTDSSRTTKAGSEQQEGAQVRNAHKQKDQAKLGELAFSTGKKTAKPAPGEVTLEEYHKAREAVYQQEYGPAEDRIVREGTSYRHAKGQFASEEAYQAQLRGEHAVTEQEQEEGVSAHEREKSPEIAKYEKLDFTELIQVAATAKQEGNDEKFAEVKAAAEWFLGNDMDESEGLENSQAELEEALARFESSIDKLIKIRAIHKQKQAEAEQKLTRTEYDGQEVEILAVYDLVDENGEKHGRMAKIRRADGSEETVDKDKITTIVAASEPKPTEKGETVIEKVSRLSTASVAAIKEWFVKEGRQYQEFGGRAYWAEKWERARLGGRTAINNVLNIGVTESMSNDEKEQKRKRNRTIALIGLGALAAGAVFVGGYATGHAAGSGGSGMAEGLAGDELASLGSPGDTSGAEADTLSEGVRDILDGNDSVAEAVIDPIQAPDVIDESSPETVSYVSEYMPDVYNIPRGMGGEELFSNMGINPAEWYSYEDDLLQKFPQDFYRMDSGHVGIAHTGMLSQEAQDYLNNLRATLAQGA